MGKAHKIRRGQGEGRVIGRTVDMTAAVDGKGNYVLPVSEPVGSPLLRSLAAKVWAEVTDGAGVVLVDGKEVKSAK